MDLGIVVILTLVARKSNYLIIRKLKDRTARAVTEAIQTVIDRRIFHTITFENGTEFHGYKALEVNRNLICCFATHCHSWERGTNENTNGLIRQYFPKGRCLANTSQAECDWIADELDQ